jgi:hypothetical protein
MVGKIDHAEGGTPSQHVHSEHPVDEEYRDDGSDNVNDPVASCFRLPKIEHAVMVAAQCRRRSAISLNPKVV